MTWVDTIVGGIVVIVSLAILGEVTTPGSVSGLIERILCRKRR